MYRITLCVLALISISTADHHHLFKKYAIKKVFESCYGEQTAKSEYEKFYQYYDDCKAQVGSGMVTPASQQQQLFNLFNQQSGVPNAQYVPFIVGQSGAPQLPYLLGRQKRSLTADKVRMLKNKMQTRKKIAVCIMNKYDMLDANDNLKSTTLKNYYQSMNIDYELKQDLIQMVDKCIKFVSCIPFQDKGPMSANLQRACAYIKCEKKKTLYSCIKKDLRKNPSKIALEGLDGALDDLDQDDQMLMVLKAYVKVGDDPFELFE